MILIDTLPLSLDQHSNLSSQFNTKTFTVWISKQYFYLDPNYKKSLIPTVLKINRETSQIQQIKMQDFITPKTSSETLKKSASKSNDFDEIYTPHYYSFFMGIININNKKVLLLAEEVEIICSIKQRDILKVKKPILIFYKSKDKYDLNEEEAKILINIIFIFEQGMYFSFSYNLTEPLHFFNAKRIGNPSFNWIRKFQKQLVNFNEMWSLPVIQGNVSRLQVFIHSHKLKIVLISRRSLNRGGPQQFTLGIDSQGNVANYVETQQIMIMNDLIFSFVQIRGSVPLYWSQTLSYGMTSKINIHKSIQQNTEAFHKHLNKITDNLGYEKIIFLNLLSSNSIESKLVQNFEYIMKKNVDDKKIFYAYFDIHKNCGQKAYDSLFKFLTVDIGKAIEDCKFTALQEKPNNKFQVLLKQTGVIRTNCLYCIDRTNITQSQIGSIKLLEILKHLDIKLSNSFNNHLKFTQDQEPFILLYRGIWADNGDQLSKQYTGTGSTESYAIRKGKLSYLTSIDHGMTSITRVLRNIKQQDLDKSIASQFLGETDNKQKNSDKINKETSSSHLKD